MLVCLLKISWSFDNFPPFTTRTPLQIMKVYNNNLFLSKCQTTPNTIGRIKMFGSWLSHAQDCVHKHANGHLSQPHFWKSVRMKFTLPKWGLGSPPGFLKFQSSIAGLKTPRLVVFFYIIKKLSKHRCRKWACMTHLKIYSTSYSKKKGRESNW
jgi:hypothetical protein